MEDELKVTEEIKVTQTSFEDFAYINLTDDTPDGPTINLI